MRGGGEASGWGRERARGATLASPEGHAARLPSLPPLQLALRHGASLVPVCVFNERRAFTRLDPPAWLRAFGLRALRTPILLIYGRWWGGS